MACPQCGGEIPATAKVCGYCLTVAARLETSGHGVGERTIPGDSASFVCLHSAGDVTLDPVDVACTYQSGDDKLAVSLSEVIGSRTDTTKETILGG